MKAIAAAMRLACQIDARLDIIWFKDWGLGCRFDELFEPLPAFPAGGCLREATWTDALFLDRPRRRNFWIPQFFERLRFDRRIDEAETTRLMNAGTDFYALCRGKRVWMSACVYFLCADDAAIPDDSFDAFVPIAPIQNAVRQQMELLGPDFVGVHIRRTDNRTSWEQSPTSLFIERMEALPPSTRFYVATDSEAVKKELSDHFGTRVLTAPRAAERGSLSGMRDAVAEMYLLSHARALMGSAGSTFSMTAAKLGRTPLTIIRRP